MLKYNSLSVGFGKKLLLKEQSGIFYPGQLVGIVGANGVGKSSFLRTLSGILPATGGEVHYFDKQVAPENAYQHASLRAYIPSAPSCHWDLKVREVLSLDRSKLDINMNRLFHTDALLNRSFLALSSGEKARVMVTHAFSRNPKIFIADEITSHLDTVYQHHILSQIKLLVRTGAVAVLVLHSVELAHHYCDYILEMKNQSLRVFSKGPRYVREVSKERFSL